VFKPLALLASGLLVALLAPGTAAAVASPIRNVPVLTDNGLYDSGKIKTSKCSGGALSNESTADAKRTLSKGKNVVYWSDRGFKSGDPGSCNTWKASSARVA
jgi:hypothetical protein